MNYIVNDQFNAFAGLTFVPFMDLTNDQDIEATSPGVNTITFTDEDDIERDNKLGLKVGGQYKISQTLAVNAEANFGTEEAYVVSIGKKF